MVDGFQDGDRPGGRNDVEFGEGSQPMSGLHMASSEARSGGRDITFVLVIHPFRQITYEPRHVQLSPGVV